MRLVFLSLAATLGLAFNGCPPSPPTPPPGSAGSGGVSVSGAGGAAGAPSPAGTGGASGSGGLAGAGGALPAPEPLCVPLPPPWGPDAALADFASKHKAALFELGPAYGPASAWVLRREPDFNAPPGPIKPGTVLVALAPKVPALSPAQLEVVRSKMGSGHVSVPGDGIGNGFRTPCPSGPPRVPGLGLDVGALPGAAPPSAKRRPAAR